MHRPDAVAVAVLLAVWFALDVAVVVVDRSDVHAAEYLTNQVWMLALVAKVALLVELFRNRGVTNDYDAVSLWGWATSLLFLVLGTAQAGVLGAFFLLTWLDSNLLDTMLRGQQHTLAEIMVWNHARHVTVCFLHLAIVWSVRHYLSHNAKGRHEVVCCGVHVGTTGETLFCVSIFAVPAIVGVLHSAIFDDQKLYMFGSADIGSKCQLAFAGTCLLATLYFVYVPLYSVELERLDPDTVARAVTIRAADSLYKQIPTLRADVTTRAADSLYKQIPTLRADTALSEVPPGGGPTV